MTCTQNPNNQSVTVRTFDHGADDLRILPCRCASFFLSLNGQCQEGVSCLYLINVEMNGADLIVMLGRAWYDSNSLRVARFERVISLFSMDEIMHSTRPLRVTDSAAFVYAILRADKQRGQG